MSRCAININLKSTAHFVGTMVLCMFAGCWEEIEYVGPDPVASRSPDAQATQTNQTGEEAPAESVSMSTTPSAEVDEAASGFADDLANSLSTEDATPSEPVAMEEATSTPSDRYALPFETAQSDQETAENQNTELEAPPGSETISLPAETASESSEQTPTQTQSADSTASTTRLDAWLLGSHLSLAALANDRGVAAESVQKWLASARLHAANLGVAVGDLPATGAAGNSQTTSRQVLSYLLMQGQEIGRELTEKHGAEHAALVEVAVKSNLLRVLYAPGSAAAAAISTAISQAAPRAELASHLWQPLVDMVAAKADASEVRKAVQQFHAAVEQHLAPAVEQ